MKLSKILIITMLIIIGCDQNNEYSGASGNWESNQLEIKLLGIWRLDSYRTILNTVIDGVIVDSEYCSNYFGNDDNVQSSWETNQCIVDWNISYSEVYEYIFQIDNIVDKVYLNYQNIELWRSSGSWTTLNDNLTLTFEANKPNEPITTFKYSIIDNKLELDWPMDEYEELQNFYTEVSSIYTKQEIND